MEDKENNKGKAEQKKAKSRTVFLSGMIDEKQVREVIEKLLELEKEHPLKEIRILIDSYGGYLDSCFALIDIIRLLMPEVSTVCVGKAMSAAAIILAAGTKGKRFISKNGRVMIHQLSGIAFGKIDDIDIGVMEFKRLQKRLEEELAELTGQKAEKIRKDMKKKDLFMDAKSAVKYGIVDKVLEFRKK